MTAIEPVTLSRAAAESLTLRIRQSGAELFTMVQEAHDRKAWAALGYKSWAAYVDAELPFSRSTSYRYLSSAPEQDALVAGGELSHRETNNSSNGQLVDAVDVDQRPLDTITPDAVLPPSAKPLAGGSGKAAASAVSKPGIDDPGSAPPPADPSSRGAELQAPAGPTDGDVEPPLRSAPLDPPEDVPVDVDAIGLRWLKSKNDRQVRALADPLGGAIRAEVKRWATAFGYSAPPEPAEKPQRRQGTITLPAERLNGTAGRPSTRVTIPTIPAPKLAKRHADDCSCLSCVPPKAVAK